MKKGKSAQGKDRKGTCPRSKGVTMEAEVINTITNSSNIIIMMLLTSGPLFGAIVIYMAYKLTHKFGERFLNAVNNIAEQTNLMREMLNVMRKDIDDVKDITVDNNKRLNDIEKRIKD